jgi:hypothetical protein
MQKLDLSSDSVASNVANIIRSIFFFLKDEWYLKSCGVSMQLTVYCVALSLCSQGFQGKAVNIKQILLCCSVVLKEDPTYLPTQNHNLKIYKEKYIKNKEKIYKRKNI